MMDAKRPSNSFVPDTESKFGNWSGCMIGCEGIANRKAFHHMAVLQVFGIEYRAAGLNRGGQ